MLGKWLVPSLLAILSTQEIQAQNRNQVANIAINGAIVSGVSAIGAWIKGNPIKKPAIIGAISGTTIGIAKYSASREEDAGLISHLIANGAVNVTINSINNQPLLSTYSQAIGPIIISRICNTECTTRYEWSAIDAINITRYVAKGYEFDARRSLASAAVVFRTNSDESIQWGRSIGNTYAISRDRLFSVTSRSCELINAVDAHERAHLITHTQAAIGAEVVQHQAQRNEFIQRAETIAKRLHLNTEGLYGELALLPLRTERKPMEREIYAAGKNGKFRC